MSCFPEFDLSGSRKGAKTQRGQGWSLRLGAFARGLLQLCVKQSYLPFREAIDSQFLFRQSSFLHNGCQSAKSGLENLQDRGESAE